MLTKEQLETILLDKVSGFSDILPIVIRDDTTGAMMLVQEHSEGYFDIYAYSSNLTKLEGSCYSPEYDEDKECWLENVTLERIIMEMEAANAYHYSRSFNLKHDLSLYGSDIYNKLDDIICEVSSVRYKATCKVFELFK